MGPPENSTLLMGFYFYPRGGSAQVARDLCRALEATAWQPVLVSGSVGDFGDERNAEMFFGGIPCEPLDYTAALDEWAIHADAMACPVPMHASFEDKADVPDRFFLDLDDAAFDRQTTSWVHHLNGLHDASPDMVHLHHLTPLHEAVRRVWPDAPVVSHLHGTELKMLAGIEHPAGSGISHPWAQHWSSRLRDWAGASDRLIVVSDQDAGLAESLLDVDTERITVIGNCVDTDVFCAHIPSATERLARWRHWLVDDPRGWHPGGGAGSERCDPAALEAFVDDDGDLVPVVVFVGRFMHFKRVQLLIEAHHRMRTTTGHRSVLVIAGGFPGEWEGEHPVDTVERIGASDVFFIGWRDHDDVSEILRCSDVFAALSVDEPFGLVFLEAMAAGLAPITTNTGGPATFINVDPEAPTGWLVPSDDVGATADALGEAVGCADERHERGARAATYVRDHHSWESTVTEFTDLYDEVIAARPGV